MRIGVDVGGTFTDAVAIGDDGRPIIAKVLSTRSTASTLEAVGVCREAGRGEPVRALAHGSTVATNTIIERTGPRVALLTTEGFTDVLELKRLGRPAELLYDLFLDTPEPLVPRALRFGVPGRIDSAGAERHPLDESRVLEVARQLAERQIQSVAICYLFSFLDASHERRTAEILAAEVPNLAITLSCDVLPEFREYERTATTVLHAYLKPVVGAYLSVLRRELAGAHLDSRVFVLQSNGGLTSPDVAIGRPATMALSGPSGGVVASSELGRRIGIDDLITVDMGGTSFDVSIVRGGNPITTQERRILDQPVRFPMVDIHTIGAGGGSVAWLDDANGLKVGPRSAGSDPGPACYDRGGTEVTVTDANVVLGMLSPDDASGGKLQPRPDLAERACAGLGGRLGLSPVDVALGIRRIVNTAMAGAIRAVTVKRGFDPRDFSLMAYGGAGPLHAADLLAELDIPWLVVPEVPGCFSAQGAVIADVRHDYVRSLMVGAAGRDVAALRTSFDDLQDEASRDLSRDGIEVRRRAFVHRLEMRYEGQNFTLVVDLPVDAAGHPVLDGAVDGFHRAHEATYGFNDPDGRVEVVNVRLEAVGGLAVSPPVGFDQPVAVDATSVTRTVYFAAEAPVATPVVPRGVLAPGSTHAGPLIVEQADTTVVVPPGYVATVEASGVLIIGSGPWR